ncbi:MAG: ribbon-helix-helix domain-containing protein [Kiritimatiellae bacterium]|nr:ribbon-helix-helix domain-containing protein [Kiritimatiellia bacterium]
MQEFRSVLRSVGEESVVARPYRMTATLTVAQKEALQELASKYKVSVAWLVREAVDRFIEEANGGPKLPFETR